VGNILLGESEIKSMRTFFLKDLSDKDFLPYEIVTSIVWGNSFNSNNVGLEIVKFKRSCLLENSYFDYIYYLEFNNHQSTTNQKVLFGHKKDNSFVALVPITYCAGRGF